MTAALLALTLVYGAVAAAADQPLLMPGAGPVPARAAAVPDARIYSAPGAANPEAVTPFTAFYVYARTTDAGAEWLQVGTDRHGGISGWLTADETIAWAQGLTVAFREAVDRDRALLYGDAAAVRELAEAQDLERYTALYRSAEALRRDPRGLAGGRDPAARQTRHPRELLPGTDPEP